MVGGWRRQALALLVSSQHVGTGWAYDPLDRTPAATEAATTATWFCGASAVMMPAGYLLADAFSRSAVDTSEVMPKFYSYPNPTLQSVGDFGYLLAALSAPIAIPVAAVGSSRAGRAIWGERPIAGQLVWFMLPIAVSSAAAVPFTFYDDGEPTAVVVMSTALATTTVISAIQLHANRRARRGVTRHPVDPD